MREEQPLAAEAGAGGGVFDYGRVRECWPMDAPLLAGRGCRSKRRRRASDAGWGDRLRLDLHGGCVYGGASGSVCLARRAAEHDEEARPAWSLIPYARGKRRNRCSGARLECGRVVRRALLGLGRLEMDVVVVPLKLAARRVAKFDVKLRLASLRAVHAMHTILTRMVLLAPLSQGCRRRIPYLRHRWQQHRSIAR